MNLTNYHCHSLFCDGHSSMEDFVLAAINDGFTSFGFSSHAPLPYHTRWNMDVDKLNSYLSEFSRLKDKYRKQIELYVGLEIDYLTTEYNPSSECFRELPLDYRIGSVHTITDEYGNIYEIDCSIEKFRSIVDDVFESDVKHVTERYLDRLVAMVEAGGFDIVGHADKMHSLADIIKPGLSGEQWYNDRIMEYFEKIAKHGYLVEMNTKKYLDKGLVFPDEKLYPLLREMGVKIVVNSDSHYTDKINSGRREGLEILMKSGYETVCELHNGHWTEVEIELS
ncbi:MAG: histidinol-phosphatase [Bacteroidales bacterium]|nr:histidinol-phosphatase [Bacteroidales bacterium]